MSRTAPPSKGPQHRSQALQTTCLPSSQDSQNPFENKRVKDEARANLRTRSGSLPSEMQPRHVSTGSLPPGPPPRLPRPGPVHRYPGVTQRGCSPRQIPRKRKGGWIRREREWVGTEEGCRPRGLWRAGVGGGGQESLRGEGTERSGRGGGQGGEEARGELGQWKEERGKEGDVQGEEGKQKPREHEYKRHQESPPT